jgi:hypothetical protein
MLRAGEVSDPQKLGEAAIDDAEIERALLQEAAKTKVEP